MGQSSAKKRSLRKGKGQAATVLNLFIGLFVVVALGCLSFEYERYMLARDELKTCVDVAALTAQTAFESFGCAPDETTEQTNEVAAINNALTIFGQNTILGRPMSGVQNCTGPNMSPLPGNAQLYFQFLDPVTRQPAAPISSYGQFQNTIGAVVQAQGAYCYQPIFPQMLGLAQGLFMINSSSIAGVPTIDLELLVDLGDSQGQLTPVTFVQRYWDNLPSDGSPPHIVYMVPGNGSGSSAQGPLNQAQGQGQNNVLPIPPQSLDWSTYNPSSCMNFTEVIGSPPGSLGNNLWNTFVIGPSVTCTHSNALLLRGQTNTGAPPGNFQYQSQLIPPYIPGPATPAATISGYTYNGYYFAGGSKGSGNQIVPNLSPIPNAPNYQANFANPNAASCQSGPLTSGSVYTDLVVNLDSSNQFVSNTVNNWQGTYSFPCVGALVEAARGNLESDAAAYQAGLDLNALGVSTQAGYQNAYLTQAASLEQPMGVTLQPLAPFVNLMNDVADIHYGFITYAGQISHWVLGAPMNNWGETTWNVSQSYPSAGQTQFAAFNFPFSLTTNAPSILAILPNANGPGFFGSLHALGGRNVALALQAAITSFNSAKARQGVNKAVVMVVNAPPNVDLAGSWDSAQAAIDARSQAYQLGQMGIPIYVVALANSSDPLYVNGEQSIFNDWDNNFNPANQNNSATAGISAIAGHGGKFYQVVWPGIGTGPGQVANQSAAQQQVVAQLNSELANVARQLTSVLH